MHYNYLKIIDNSEILLDLLKANAWTKIFFIKIDVFVDITICLLVKFLFVTMATVFIIITGGFLKLPDMTDQPLLME
jgi:hypothetical protein